MRSRRVNRAASSVISGSALNPLVLDASPMAEIGRDEVDDDIEVVAWTGSVEHRPNDVANLTTSQDEVCSLCCQFGR